MKPSIAITCKQYPKNYIVALEAVGIEGTAIYAGEKLSWYQAAELAKKISKKFDGLLLAGGGDVHPVFYEQELNGTKSDQIDILRDRLELAVLAEFAALNKTILGICRGCQIINIAFGGTLIQDMAEHSQKNGEDILHKVKFNELPKEIKSWQSLHKDFGGNGAVINANSAHHQAVDIIADGIIPWAISEDEVVEAIVHESLPILGVQWHPERHSESGIHIFKHLRSML